MKPDWRDEHGLTLLELLGAIVLLSILIMSVITLSHYHNTSNYRTQTETEAIRAAEYVLHEFRSIVSASDDEMTAWLAIDKTGRWEENHSFSYKVDAVPLADHDDHPASPIVQEQAVALPGIILLENEPWLVTVTVTWGEAS